MSDIAQTPKIDAAAAAPASAPAAAPAASFGDFSSKKMVEGSTEFLESNSWIAKLAFLLMVIIGFVILFRVMVALLTWLFAPSGKVVLIKGLMNGSQSTIISQDPNIQNSITILRSSDEKDGIEFTWSTWLYLNGFAGDAGMKSGTYIQNPIFEVAIDKTYDTSYKHVFNKGSTVNSGATGNGIATPNNAPGLYLRSDYTGFIVVLDTFYEPTQVKVSIDDLPMTKWINVIIRVQNNNCDIYVNGRLVKRHVMTQVVKQNYDNVNVCLNGGFSGYLADLTYFNSAISVVEIQNIISTGPNTKPVSKSLDVGESKPRYLADAWYFNQVK
jgi:hypothetical protein